MKRKIITTGCIIASVIIFSCKKSGSSPASVTPITDSTLYITIDTAKGSIARKEASDTFVVDLKYPSLAAQVPVVLHTQAGAVSGTGTAAGNQLWNDTINISNNNVVRVVITDKNGKSHSYYIGFKYIITNYTNGPATSIHAFHALAFLHDTLIAGTDTGFTIWPSTGSTFINRTGGMASVPVFSVAQYNGRIYAITGLGLYVSADMGLHFSVYGTAQGLPGGSVYYAWSDGKSIYIGDAGGLSYLTAPATSFSNYTTANGLANNNVYCALVTPAGDVVAGTGSGLSIKSAAGSVFTTATTSGGLLSNNVLSLAIYNNTLYVGMQNGISVLPAGTSTFINYTTANGLGARVNGIYADSVRVIAATEGGISIGIPGGNFFRTCTTVNGLPNNEVNAVLVHNNIIYAATGSGLTLMQPR